RHIFPCKVRLSGRCRDNIRASCYPIFVSETIKQEQVTDDCAFLILNPSKMQGIFTAGGRKEMQGALKILIRNSIECGKKIDH
ncbi:MAG: hypothetical protein PUK34_09235, partial [Clostridia bacterium]|nr:hypothetical protein [Clostridia bacterium]